MQVVDNLLHALQVKGDPHQFLSTQNLLDEQLLPDFSTPPYLDLDAHTQMHQSPAGGRQRETLGSTSSCGIRAPSLHRGTAAERPAEQLPRQSSLPAELAASPDWMPANGVISQLQSKPASGKFHPPAVAHQHLLGRHSLLHLSQVAVCLSLLFAKNAFHFRNAFLMSKHVNRIALLQDGNSSPLLLLPSPSLGARSMQQQRTWTPDLEETEPDQQLPWLSQFECSPPNGAAARPFCPQSAHMLQMPERILPLRLGSLAGCAVGCDSKLYQSVDKDCAFQWSSTDMGVAGSPAGAYRLDSPVVSNQPGCISAEHWYQNQLPSEQLSPANDCKPKIVTTRRTSDQVQ